MRPKINVFILLLVYYNFTLSSCDEEKDRLTDEKIIEIVEPANISEPNDDTKRDYIGDSWIVQIDLKNGTKITLNLTLTEGILIDNETPIWNALNSSGSGIEYTLNNEIMSRLGDFDLYQDYANKAAVAVFHKDNYIEGWVAYHRLERSNFPSDLGVLKKQKSSPYSQSAGLSTGIPSEWDGIYKETGPRTPPDVVYPEILIHLDRAEVSKDQEAAVRSMIGYWNAVDMLYSKLKNPQIKINIAGMIIPEDNSTTPWFTSSKYQSWNETRVSAVRALYTLGTYFSTLRHQFPDDSYDFIFSFTSEQLSGFSGIVTGAARLNAHCRRRENRVAMIRTWAIYQASAHELAHLLSNQHDDDSQCEYKSGIMGATVERNVEQLEWSECSTESFTNYFRGSRTKCFDNCPSTIKNCEKPPIRRCLIMNYDVCKFFGYRYKWQQKLDCVKDVECIDRSYGQRRVVFVPILNGTIIQGYTHVCRNGQVVLRPWIEPVCRV